MKTGMKPDDRLFEVADAQQGFFTTREARASGYADNVHGYHVERGNWIREERGIYRLARYPEAEEAQLVVWSLWSRNRAGERQGVYSHQTALALHDLTDANPSKLHMAVPKAFRRLNETPKILVLHRVELTPLDIEERRGHAVTRPLRTICDLAAEGSTTDATLALALRQALERGTITRSQLRAATRVEPKLETLRAIAEGEKA